MTPVIFTEDYLSICKPCLTNLSDQGPYSSAHLATAHKKLVQATTAWDAEVSARHCNSSDQRTSKWAQKMDQLMILFTPWPDNSSPSGLLSALNAPLQPIVLHCPAHSSFTQVVYLTLNGFFSSQCRVRALGHPSLTSLQHQDYRPQRTLQIFKVLQYNLHRCYFCILPVKMS